jgi:hypothetical protein
MRNFEHKYDRELHSSNTSWNAQSCNVTENVRVDLVWQELGEYRDKLHALEKKFGHSSHEYEEEVKEIEGKFGKGKAV